MVDPAQNAPQDQDIQAWVFAAQEGDKDAFARLYDHFFDGIYRYVYYRVPPAEVDDIVETVFIKAWVNLEKYEKRDVNFSSWLFRIAHNAVIDHRRSHRSLELLDPALADDKEENAPARTAERNLMSAQVREAVEKLREPYRQVVLLKFLSGLSNHEIAEVLGEREGNVRVMQFRALKELKKMLSERGF